jgi:hypothetical protein
MSSFNGTGTFQISGTGLPFVAGTTISETVANQLNTDLAAGLTNCICKDGQQVATAQIPFVLGATFGGTSAFTSAGKLAVGSAGPVSTEIAFFNGAIRIAANTSITMTGFGNTTTISYNGSVSTNDGNGIQIVCVSGGVVLNNGATSWAAISDERLKTDLVPIDHGTDKLASLRACTGRYMTDRESVVRAFLIAQDVQKVLPEAVTAKDGVLHLAYTDVIPLLVAAVKELTARVKALEAK